MEEGEVKNGKGRKGDVFASVKTNSWVRPWKRDTIIFQKSAVVCILWTLWTRRPCPLDQNFGDTTDNVTHTEFTTDAKGNRLPSYSVV